MLHTWSLYKWLSLAALLHVPASAVFTLDQQIAALPPLPNWQNFFEQLPKLSRPLRVACPCSGIAGGAHALASMQVVTEYAHVYDLQDCYTQYLQAYLHLGREALHLGRESRDMLRVPLQSLLGTAVDMLLAGPPCPPGQDRGRRRHKRKWKLIIMIE